MGGDPDRLLQDMTELRRLAEEAGTEPGPVTLLAPLPLPQAEECAALLERYAELGVERLVCALRYDTLTEYQRALDRIERLATHVTHESETRERYDECSKPNMHGLTLHTRTRTRRSLATAPSPT